jgi:hypothetical protein
MHPPIPTRVHGVIDYAVGGLVTVAPWLLGFADDRVATAVTVSFGVVAILYSLLTDYELGLYRVLPFRVHLLVDVVWSLGLIASPWLFHFAHRIAWLHVAVGVAGLIVTALTQRPPLPQHGGFSKSAEQVRLKEAGTA